MTTIPSTLYSSSSPQLPPSLPTSPENRLKLAIDSKNTKNIRAALVQTKAGDTEISALLITTLTSKDNGLNSETKLALCDYLQGNGFDFEEPLQRGKTLAEIARENEDDGLIKILEHNSKAITQTDPLQGVNKAITRATIVAGAVAIPPSILDKAVAEKSSGISPSILKGVQSGVTQLYKQPFEFFKGKFYGPMAGVYLATYGTANVTEAMCNNLGLDPTWYKLGLSSAANILFSNFRDSFYTQISGKGSIRPTPILSKILYAKRDCLTIGAGFTLPNYVAQYLKNQYHFSEKSAVYAGQLATPLVMQFIITPVHLLALDLYNNPVTTLKNRFFRIQQQYPAATMARMGRSLSVYSIGGLLNDKLKQVLIPTQPNI